MEVLFANPTRQQVPARNLRYNVANGIDNYFGASHAIRQRETAVTTTPKEIANETGIRPPQERVESLILISRYDNSARESKESDEL